MDITVTEELKTYFRKKAYNSITLENVMNRVCCASPPLPSVRVGQPTNMDTYYLYEVDGIKVYIHKDIKYRKNLLRIGVRKFLFIYEVYAYDPETICFCSGDR